MSDIAGQPIQVGAMTVLFHVDADQSGGSVTVFECVAPSKARMPAPHSHDDFDETVFGLEGVTSYTVGGERIDLKPGESLFVPRRVIHGFDNQGDVDARFLAIISPGLLGPSYFRRTGPGWRRLCAATASLPRHPHDSLTLATAGARKLAPFEAGGDSSGNCHRYGLGPCTSPSIASTHARAASLMSDSHEDKH